MRLRWFTVAIAVALCIGVASSVLAQRRRGFGFGAPLRMATPESFDGGFNFCRIIFLRATTATAATGAWTIRVPTSTSPSACLS